MRSDGDLELVRFTEIRSFLHIPSLKLDLERSNKYFNGSVEKNMSQTQIRALSDDTRFYMEIASG